MPEATSIRVSLKACRDAVSDSTSRLTTPVVRTRPVKAKRLRPKKHRPRNKHGRICPVETRCRSGAELTG
jgi:hypothetical protein